MFKTKFIIKPLMAWGCGLSLLAPALATHAAQPTPEVIVAPEAGSLKLDSAIATDALGNSVVVWRQRAPTAADQNAQAVFGQRYGADGAARGVVFRINTATTSVTPVVAMDGQGNFFVVWAGPLFASGAGNAVRGRRYDSAGAPAGDEFTIASGPLSLGSRQVDVAMNTTGAATVVWDDTEQVRFGLLARDAITNTSVRLQRYAASGLRAGIAQTVANSTDYEISGTLPITDSSIRHEQDRFARVAVNDSGAAVVAWIHEDTFGAGVIYARRYAASGIAQAAGFQVSGDSSLVLSRDRFGRVNSYTTGPKVGAAVALDSAGLFTIAWRGSNVTEPASSGLFVRRYGANGQPTGAESLIEASVGRVRTQSDSRLALDGSGNPVLGWVSIALDADNRPSAYDIRAQRFDVNGSALGTPIQLNTRIGEQVVLPVLAPLPGAGRFLAVWTSHLPPFQAGGVLAEGDLNLVRCCDLP